MSQPETLEDLNAALPSLPTLYGVPEGAQALAIAGLLEGADTRPLLHVASSDREMESLRLALKFFAPDADILEFPAWDCLPYDRASPHQTIMAKRIATLTRLAAHQLNNTIVLTTPSALMMRVVPHSFMQEASFSLRANETLNLAAFQHYLQQHGYRRASKVMEPAEYALRGNIIDLFPSGDESAYRIDLFGDDIETIKRMDVLTQRSEGEPLRALALTPAGEITLNESSIRLFRESYRERFGTAHRDDALYAAISVGQVYAGMEHWLPLFFESTDTLFDYLPNARITLAQGVLAAFGERGELIQDYYQARVMHAEQHRKKDSYSAPYHPIPPELLYLRPFDVFCTLEQRTALTFSPFAAPSESLVDAKCVSIRSLFSQKDDQTPVERLSKQIHAIHNKSGRITLIACQTQGSVERVQKLLEDQHGKIAQVLNWKEALKAQRAAIAIVPIAQGFAAPEVTIYSEQDIFGEKLARVRRKKKASEAFMAEAAGFEVGELVVHREHGIGRFDGLVTVEALGNRHDCLKLVYRDDDRLFLPVENIELVSRFGADDDHTELDKLGAGGWQARKARMKEKIRMAAEELMNIAAARALREGAVLECPDGVYGEFAARFPYEETEDQARSIDEVLEDLASGKPMDRLICGDVGFGKTEVALRAAFVAAAGIEPKQVALVVPTTLLARQHYRNFEKRFEGTGLRVAQLSRFTSAKEAKLIREGLADGSVHIVVGTHALLSDSVKFDNLGLLIIDEEQHFGVKQKEKLKAIKADVHILTLSATPIPRTLQLALSGVRELSLITTPPLDRLAVRTFVMPVDTVVLREAIHRELHRGGQVFYVAPRIADLADLKQMIMEIAPTARLAVAHGQMSTGDLDDVMNHFYDGNADILLSTAIVESGIDVPTANTLIVHRADKFGLSQLYQLRGRVGRGKIRAYAYLTLPNQHHLSAQALKRLEVMQALDTLGAGFSLASHDMDIRGFGNLVGEEQSGHVKEVGVELYQQMLEEAVNAAKQQQSKDKAVAVEEQWSPQINLGMSILIPETYVEDLALRLSLYRRLSTLQDDNEIDAFAAEMVDRFGSLPQEVVHLLDVLRLKRTCIKLGISKLDTGPKGAVITFRNNQFAAPDALIGFLARNMQRMKLRPDQTIFCALVPTEDNDLRIRQVSGLLGELAALVS